MNKKEEVKKEEKLLTKHSSPRQGMHMKKIVLVAMTSILANIAYAEQRDLTTASSNNLGKTQTLEWINKLFKMDISKGDNYVRFSGKTRKNGDCELIIRFPMLSRNDPDLFYVTVISPDLFRNWQKHFIEIGTNNRTGFTFLDKSLNFNNAVTSFYSAESLGYDQSISNWISIILDEDYLPLEVTAEAIYRPNPLLIGSPNRMKSTVCSFKKTAEGTNVN